MEMTITNTNEKTYNVSCYLRASGNFKNMSDNIEVLAYADTLASEEHIIINNTLCDVVMGEIGYDKNSMELFFTMPVKADSEFNAEYITNILLHNAQLDIIHLLDNQNNKVHSVPLKQVAIERAEYFENE